MAVDTCDDGCLPQLDVTQMGEIYDQFNTKIRTDLQDDYDCKKINGATYADTWAKLMSTVIKSTLDSVLALKTRETPHDRCVKEAECALKTAQTNKIDYETSDILPANKDQIIRQTEGFDDNLRQKLFDSQMNSWAMMFSSGLLEDKPSIISNDEVSGLYNSIKNEVEQYLGHWDVDMSITDDGGSFTFNWGAVIPVANAGSTITYELEILTSEVGMMSTFPKIVLASAEQSGVIILPHTERDVVIVANINAKDENGLTSFSSVTKRLPKP